MNISELAQAFDCALGSAMDQTNTVWYSLLGARCNVPLMNMPEFAQGFNCALGSAMNQTSRCGAMWHAFSHRIPRLQILALK
ncbi:hypothetical protein HPB48_004808 [Haemaphysalis longicornis]|uniref:Peptidase M13 C-terminal domain-containing protein n=1 Tax=Haemaphysalis longicornis TaxID=44386 RepID=A0A9J6FER8_HAELO|nr:hypothetical protein HPB48_004808 [Haemaphysalis longicornis]